MSEEKSNKRKLFDRLVGWLLGQAKGQLDIAKRVGKKFFWLGFLVGGGIGTLVGALLAWLIIG